MTVFCSLAESAQSWCASVGPNSPSSTARTASGQRRSASVSRFCTQGFLRWHCAAMAATVNLSSWRKE